MIAYERNLSFSLLRGLICTTAPLAVVFVAAAMYFAFAYDYPYTDAFSTASKEVRWWYRTFPLYILSSHAFVFLATIFYRRRLVNWWAQIVAITGVCFIALLGYYTLNPGKTPAILLPHEAREALNSQPKASPPPPSPNLLSGVASTVKPRIEVLPDSSGMYTVNARSLSADITFILDPRADFTTIAYERLADFSAYPCQQFQLPTGNGPVEACSMNLPELNINGLVLRHVNVVFVSTLLTHSYLGRDSLTALGFKRGANSILLGPH
jgi:hypothetical protein